MTFAYVSTDPTATTMADQSNPPETVDVLAAVFETLQQRKQADPSSSYVASLYAKGADKILKKLGEEATEVIIAAKNPDDNAVVYEMADLWFHALVLLASRDIPPQRILDELARRMGVSGLAEKASRTET